VYYVSHVAMRLIKSIYMSPSIYDNRGLRERLDPWEHKCVPWSRAKVFCIIYLYYGIVIKINLSDPIYLFNPIKDPILVKMKTYTIWINYINGETNTKSGSKSLRMPEIEVYQDRKKWIIAIKTSGFSYFLIAR